jgi:hypothetical protein
MEQSLKEFNSDEFINFINNTFFNHNLYDIELSYSNLYFDIFIKFKSVDIEDIKVNIKLSMDLINDKYPTIRYKLSIQDNIIDDNKKIILSLYNESNA